MNAYRLVVATLFLVLGSAQVASASIQGTVSGTLRFYENEGQYCPNSRNCTHAQYVQAQWHTNMPIPEAVVYLWDQQHSAYVGQGSTNGSGQYTISYFSTFNSIDVRLIWVPEHKDGRFKVLKLDDTRYWHWATGPGTINGSYSVVGADYTWGSAGSLPQVPNTYSGAWRAWDKALKYSNPMLLYINDLALYAYDPASLTSSAAPSQNKIVLDPSSMYAPQSRVMHEMGHVAEYFSAHGQARNGYPTANYCFGGEAQPCGWTNNTTESESVVFVESIANFVADVAIYWYDSPAPHHCNSISACADDVLNIETSVGPGGCNADDLDFRRPANGTRYFWDLYDAVNGDESTIDIPHVPFHSVLDTATLFPEGTANHQENEFSVSSDGKGLADFGWHFADQDMGGPNSGNELGLRFKNCAWSPF